MTMTVGARSLDNEERSNFRDYMSCCPCPWMRR